MWRPLLVLLVVASACRRQPTPPVAPREQKRTHEPVASRELTPALALARIQSAYRAGVQRCYQSRLKRDPSARGRVVVTFTVDDTGRVAFRRAQGVHRTVEQCVERAMSRWAFPPPAEQTTFRLALRLSSRA